MIQKTHPGAILAATALLICVCAMSGCARGAGPKAEVEEEPLSRTEFTERIENFFEYEPLKAGRPSQFLIHLTDLSDGSPVEKAEVTLSIRAEGGAAEAAQTKAKVGKVTGIYVAEVNIARKGEYDIEFHVKNSKLDERMPLSDFKVVEYSVLSRRGAKEEAAAASGTVKFLMEQQWRIRMKLALAEEKTIARQITATGRVIPAANQHAAVAPAISGLIERGPLPRLGQRVTAGQTIAVLRQIVTAADRSQIRAAQAQAQAQDAQVALDTARLEAERHEADGQIEAARVRLEQSRREADRARMLHEQQVLPKQEAERAETQSKTAQADYNAAVLRRKALNEARTVAPLKSAGDSANEAHAIRAPISGVVTKVNKNLGEQVAAGEAILEITNLDTVWVEAPVFERDLGLLGKNAQASFTTAVYPGQEFRGALVDLGSVVDENKRAATAVFSVPNRGRALRIGMQADVRMDAGESVTAMMIPREAVVEDEGKKIIYVLLSGEEFQRREVKLGNEYGEKVAVLEGLKAGERVVTQGALQLKLHELNPGEGPAHTHET